MSALRLNSDVEASFVVSGKQTFPASSLPIFGLEGTLSRFRKGDIQPAFK
jgi:hypothetical protein